MGKERSKSVARAKADAEAPRCLAIADKGVRSSADFRNFFAAVMEDVIRGTISPEKANAASNAGGKVLKTIELEYKFGIEKARPVREISLAGSPQLATG